MADINYIPKTHEGYTFEPDYKQVFHNKWTLNIGHDELVKMRNNGFITDSDMKIVKFLFKYRFATAEMMFRYMGDESKIENMEARLDKLVKFRILNKFMLSKVDAETIVPDALQIYCLDIGGRTLLSHYSNEDTTNWVTTVNMKGSEVISRDLVTANFYIKLMETCPKKVKYFKLNPQYRIGRIMVVPSFEMGIIDGDHLKYFIGEVVRDYDFPSLFRDRLTNIESILCTQAWKKYYYDIDTPPMLFVFAENDKNALDVAKMIVGTTEIEAFRITTDQRLKKELYEAGVFLKYDKNKNILQGVRTTIFARKTSKKGT